MHYENKPPCGRPENKAKTNPNKAKSNPKQSQTKPKQIEDPEGTQFNNPIAENYTRAYPLDARLLSRPGRVAKDSVEGGRRGTSKKL